MANFIEADVIQKIATPEQWATQDRIPYKGQIMLVSDSAGKVINIKVGDGVNDFSGLVYMFDSIQQNANFVPTESGSLPTPTAEVAFTILGDTDYGSIPAKEGYMRIASWSSGSWSVIGDVKMPEILIDGEVEEGNEDAVSGDTTYKGIPKAWKEQYDSMVVDKTYGRNGGSSAYTSLGGVTRVHYNSLCKLTENSVVVSFDIDIQTAGNLIIVIGTQSDFNSATPFLVRYTSSIIPVTVGLNTITLNVNGLVNEYIGIRGDSTAVLRYGGTSDFLIGNNYIQAYTTPTTPSKSGNGAGLSYSVKTSKGSIKTLISEDFAEKTVVDDIELSLEDTIETVDKHEEDLNYFVFDKRESLNALNPSNFVPNCIVSGTTGVFISNTSYNGLDFNEVEPSTQYFAKKSNNTNLSIRQVAFFDENEVFISYSEGPFNNFTTPSGCRYIRLAIVKTEGEDFVEFGLFKPGDSFSYFNQSSVVKIDNTAPTLSKEDDEIALIGDIVEIAKSISDKTVEWSLSTSGQLVVNYSDLGIITGGIRNTRGYSGNNMFNFNNTSLKGVTITASDDVAPMHIFGMTLGANHGFLFQIATITAHGFNNTIIGQEFTKGGIKFYPMRIVDSNRVAFMSENAGTEKQLSFTALTTGTITHDSVDYTISSVQTADMYPSLGVVTCEVFADGVKQVLGSNGFSNKIDVVETYNIYNPSSVLDNTIARAGQSGDNDFVGDTAVIVKNIYTFREMYNCVVTTNVLFKQELTPFNDIMGTQAQPIGNVSSTYYYIPNSNALNASIDLRKPTIIPWSSSLPTTYVVKATSPQPSNPPNRVIMYNGNLGFMIGYVPNYNDLGRMNRMFELRNNTGKVYPHPVEGNVSGATRYPNDSYDVKLYRTYTDLTKTRKDGRLSYFVVEDENDTYIFIDYSATMFDELLIDIPKLNGRDLTVIESKNVVLKSKSFNQGFNVQATYVEGETCYLVVKI